MNRHQVIAVHGHRVFKRSVRTTERRATDHLPDQALSHFALKSRVSQALLRHGRVEAGETMQNEIVHHLNCGIRGTFVDASRLSIARGAAEQRSMKTCRDESRQRIL